MKCDNCQHFGWIHVDGHCEVTDCACPGYSAAKQESTGLDDYLIGTHDPGEMERD